MYRNTTATKSYSSLAEMQEREDTKPRNLSLASAKLDKLLNYDGERVSPALSSAKYSTFFSSTSALSSPVDPFSPASEDFGPVSLPPPPRRNGKRKKAPPVPLKQESLKSSSASDLGSAAAPTTSHEGVEPEEPQDDEKSSLKKLEPSNMYPVGGRAESSLLTADREIKSQPSFEELVVVHRKTFTSDRPRIIPTVSIPPLLSIPAVPTPITELSEQSELPYASDGRLPVDDRDTPPPTPIRSTLGSRSDVNGGSKAVAGFGQSPALLRYAMSPMKSGQLQPNKKKRFFASSDSSPMMPYDEPRSGPGSPSVVRGASKTEKVRERENGPEMQQTSAVAANVWRSRPLISHGKTLSLSSCESGTTYNPPSTIHTATDKRISISSSIYPDSPAHPLDDDDDDNDDASYIHIGSPVDHNGNDSDDLHDILHQIQNEQIIDPDNYQLMSILAGSRVSQPQPQSRDSGLKPPLPTTPKPRFSRRALSPRSVPSSPSQSPIISNLVFEGYETANDDLPPTTNWLGQEERTDLIRKSRKLARVFGRTPGPEVMAQQDNSRTSQFASRQPRHQRTPLSFSNDLDNHSGLKRRRASVWPSPTDTQFVISTGRRHSAPLSPDDISFLNASSPLYEASLSQVASQFRSESAASESKEPSNDHPVVKYETEHHSPSPHTSFIDLYLSEDEANNDGPTITLSDSNKSAAQRPSSPSAHSLLENMTPEQQAEEERRRKREKLAKLHRYLGSRVPTNLVLGVSDPEIHLPPARPSPTKASSSEAEDSARRKAWLRRRQSSSAALPSTWHDELERRKEELDTKEKALNVRRAQKMEKVFGVAPPQTLYHTRHTPSPSIPTAPKTFGNPSTFIPSSEVVFFTRNPNQSSYQKSKNKKNNRPGTAESTKALLPKDRRSSTGFDDSTTKMPDIFYHGLSAGSHNGGGSAIYNHYQHSMNSLNDILDRDDRASLLELHNYINGGEEAPDAPVHIDNDNDNDNDTWEDAERDSFTRDRALSNASIRTERRRSLPTRISNTSLASEHSATSPKPDITDFQLRRRRAAKLTQFFGVHYRELINDVLDSLENGLEHERKRGTLQAEEIEDLVQRLRELKIKREGIF